MTIAVFVNGGILIGYNAISPTTNLEHTISYSSIQNVAQCYHRLYFIAKKQVGMVYPFYTFRYRHGCDNATSDCYFKKRCDYRDIPDDE